jgi:hypothetical protein
VGLNKMEELDNNIRELFKDLVKHTNNPLINESIDLYTYDELGGNNRDGWTLFLIKEEPILVHLNKNRKLLYFTKKEYLRSILEKKGSVFVIPKEEYSLHLLYIIILDLNNKTYDCQSYKTHRSDYLNKIFYFLEIPIDGYILSQYNIYPDIEATTIEKLIKTNEPSLS